MELVQLGSCSLEITKKTGKHVCCASCFLVSILCVQIYTAVVLHYLLGSSSYASAGTHTCRYQPGLFRLAAELQTKHPPVRLFLEFLGDSSVWCWCIGRDYRQTSGNCWMAPTSHFVLSDESDARADPGREEEADPGRGTN